jgi:hypothetical protein
MWTNVKLWQYLAEFFSEWEFLQVKGVEKVKTYILYSTFFRKLRVLWNNVEQNGGAEEAIEDNVAHAHCMATNTH